MLFLQFVADRIFQPLIWTTVQCSNIIQGSSMSNDTRDTTRCKNRSLTDFGCKTGRRMRHFPSGFKSLGQWFMIKETGRVSNSHTATSSSLPAFALLAIALSPAVVSKRWAHRPSRADVARTLLASMLEMKELQVLKRNCWPGVPLASACSHSATSRPGARRLRSPQLFAGSLVAPYNGPFLHQLPQSLDWTSGTCGEGQCMNYPERATGSGYARWQGCQTSKCLQLSCDPKQDARMAQNRFPPKSRMDARDPWVAPETTSRC